MSDDEKDKEALERENKAADASKRKSRIARTVTKQATEPSWKI